MVAITLAHNKHLPVTMSNRSLPYMVQTFDSGVISDYDDECHYLPVKHAIILFYYYCMS